MEATEDMRLIENLKKELASIEPLDLTTVNSSEIKALNSYLESINIELENSLSVARAELASSIQREVSINNELRLMQQSISWQITRPLRSLKSWMRK